MKFFEDIRVGDTYALGRHTFTADDIKAFATRFDPQPFHVDEAAARNSHFGATVRLGLAHRGGVDAADGRLPPPHGRGGARPRRAGRAPSARRSAFANLKWLKPVYAGDTIDYASEVVGSARLRKPAGLGLMTIRSTGINQNGELVISFVSTTFVERRTKP